MDKVIKKLTCPWAQSPTPACLYWWCLLLQFVPSSEKPCFPLLSWVFPLFLFFLPDLFFSILYCRFFCFMLSNHVMIFLLPFCFSFCSFIRTLRDMEGKQTYRFLSLVHSIYNGSFIKRKNQIKTREKCQSCQHGFAEC